MRFHAKGALLLFCLAALPATLAQQKHGSNTAYRATREDPDPQPRSTELRTLTSDEGLAILGAALESRHRAAPSDCSHLVHALYERAGFPYRYASSSDLYTGIDEFRRVTNPQPGDLAVWRGHTGIVVNPLQHSFFSLLSSGPGVESYDSPYWRRRGRPRFFRYVHAATPEGAVSSSLRTASLNPTTLGNAATHEPEAEDTVADASEESTNIARPPARSSTRAAPNQVANAIIPLVAVVHSGHPKPDQVNAAFLQASADAEESLRGRDLLKSTQPLIVFDRFTVSKVHIAGSQNWAEVQIDELLSLRGGKTEVQRRSERQRWPLVRRDKTSWELVVPRGEIYLPEHIAARILSQQLAQLTQDSPGAATKAQENDKAKLARLLDVLLQK
jgi:hypothetical protein